jgi:hypothetical protein
VNCSSNFYKTLRYDTLYFNTTWYLVLLNNAKMDVAGKEGARIIGHAKALRHEGGGLEGPSSAERGRLGGGAPLAPLFLPFTCTVKWREYPPRHPLQAGRKRGCAEGIPSAPPLPAVVKGALSRGTAPLCLYTALLCPS